MEKIKWTKEEDRILLDNASKPVCNWFHLLPGRTIGSIAIRAYRLGSAINKQEKQMRGSLEERFWQYVEIRGTDECWEWIGAKSNKGYGTIVNTNSHRKVLSHRVSWEIHNGPIPVEKSSYHGICVLHKCDNPACVNPHHLAIGTHKDNMQDMHKKGRNASIRTKSILTEQCVEEIKQKLQNSNLSLRSIAAKYGVSHNTIWFIKHGKQWKSVK